MTVPRVRSLLGPLAFATFAHQVLGQEPQRAAPVALRSAQECAAIALPPAAGTNKALIREPTLREARVPPAFPDKYRNAVVFVQLRVNTAGQVDSITVSGMPDRGYVKEIGRTLGKSLFRPATYDGCPVVRWTSLTLTGDRR